MGRGIITIHGANPLVEWRARLIWIGSEELSADVRSLMSGDPVISEDGVLELSFQVWADPLYRLTARRPNAPYCVDIFLRALQTNDSVKVAQGSRDNRDPLPIPDQWMNDISEHRRVIELFNCVVHLLSTRNND